MSPSSPMSSADAQATLEDPRSTPDLSADPTSFDDPVRKARWLEEALCCALDMDREDAKMICGLVIEHFRDKDEILDDEIPNEVRSVFYTLEKKRILTFRRIEYENEDGATLRGFFWRLNPDWEPPEGAQEDEQGDNVYDQLPEDCWERKVAS